MPCTHKAKNLLYRSGSIPLYRCDDCELVFTDNHGKDIDPKSLYENYYRNEIGIRFGFGVEHLIALFRFFRALKVVTLSPRARTILDVGSGRGWMLYYLKKYYHYRRSAGTQISKNAVEFSRNKLGLEIYDQDLLALPLEDKSFEVVTMWHVLEHVTKPEEYIEKIKALLTDGGRLIIEVPNFNSWTRAFTQQYWLGLDLEYHITFFTAASLACLLRKCGLEVKSVHTFSLEYSTFLSAQSIISRITQTDQLFFRSLQAGAYSPWLFLHGLLFIIIAPLCFIINVLLYFSKRGEVLLMIAKK